jgi:hypothetical protein
LQLCELLRCWLWSDETGSAGKLQFPGFEPLQARRLTFVFGMIDHKRDCKSAEFRL